MAQLAKKLNVSTHTQDKALIQYGPASQETQCEYTHNIRH